MHQLATCPGITWSTRLLTFLTEGCTLLSSSRQQICPLLQMFATLISSTQGCTKTSSSRRRRRHQHSVTYTHDQQTVSKCAGCICMLPECRPAHLRLLGSKAPEVYAIRHDTPHDPRRRPSTLQQNYSVSYISPTRFVLPLASQEQKLQQGHPTQAAHGGQGGVAGNHTSNCKVVKWTQVREEACWRIDAH